MMTDKKLSIRGANANNGVIFAVIPEHRETLQAERQLFPLSAHKTEKGNSNWLYSNIRKKPVFTNKIQMEIRLCAPYTWDPHSEIRSTEGYDKCHLSASNRLRATNFCSTF